VTKLFDISLPLSADLPVWPGNAPFALEPVHRMANGDHCNESGLRTNIHTGTHIDVPWHFFEDGCKTDAVALRQLIGPAEVVFVPGVRCITSEVLRSLNMPDGTKRLLFKTDNSKLWAESVKEFQPDFVALTVDAAELLVAFGIELVGIDYLSIQLFDDDARTHEILLRSGVVILEGLNLHDIAEGTYELVCLPLSIQGAEGAPARAILRR
jgi:arylformamidase